MDKTRTIKTFKSGIVTFSAHYDASRLMEALTESKTLYMTIKDLPIIPQFAVALQGELIRRSIFGTAAIEGNPLTEERVARIVESPPDASQRLERFEKEITNLQEAYNEFVVRCSRNEGMVKLEEDHIKNVHKIVTNKIEHETNAPGKYRNGRVKVSDREHGGVYTPPKILDDIKTLMSAFVEWINSDEVLELEPIIRAALAHYYLGFIHPFRDGNGRTARIIESYILTCSGYKYVPIMMSNYYYRNIDEYFLAFSLTEKSKNKDMTHFLEFMARGFAESLKEIKDRIMLIIRGLALRDYYSFLKSESAINQRQYDLLILMLGRTGPLSFRELLEKPPTSVLFRDVVDRTARRDLNKLCELGAVKFEQNKYSINHGVLDFQSVVATKPY